MKPQSDSPSNARLGEAHPLGRWAADLLMGDLRPWPESAEGAATRAAMAFFRAQGLGPLCHHSLQAAGARHLVPAAVWDLLSQERRTAVAIDLVRSQRDAQVIGWLIEAGLRPLVLKGAAYARTLYPEPHLRPRCDTDLLLPDRDAAQAAWTRLMAGGYQLDANVVEGRLVSRQRTCTLPLAGGHSIDLHWAIGNTHSFVRALPQTELRREAVPLATLHPGAETLGPVHSLLFACLHWFGHERDSHCPRLLWSYDIYRLAGRLGEADWTALGDKAVAGRVAGVCRHVLDRVGLWFPMPEASAIRPVLSDAETREVFRPDRVRGHLGYAFYDLCALDGWRERLQWLAETIFPAPAYMRQKYAGAGVGWLPLLYLRRAATGISRRLRGKGSART